MAHKTGWFPARRDGIIHRGGAWSGQTDLHSQAWGIPPDRIAAFKNRPAAGGIRNGVPADAPLSGRALLPHRVADYRLGTGSSTRQFCRMRPALGAAS